MLAFGLGIGVVFSWGRVATSFVMIDFKRTLSVIDLGSQDELQDELDRIPPQITIG